MFDRNRNTSGAPAASPLSFFLALGTIALVSGVANAKAQEAEPRSYSNTPVGLNFLIAGDVYSEGKLAFDPNLSIADAKFHSNTGLLAYVRSFDFAGQSAKFDVIVPASSVRRPGLCGRPAAASARCRAWVIRDFVSRSICSGLRRCRRRTLRTTGRISLLASAFRFPRRSGSTTTASCSTSATIAGRSSPNSGFPRPGVPGHSSSPPA